MKRRIHIFIPFAVLAVALLAYLLRGAVQEWIILPLARFFWMVKGYYGAFPQADYWVIALGIVALVGILALRLPGWESRRPPEQGIPSPGSVREMSFWIQRGRTGIYPKWHVAHFLAALAIDILDRRGTHQKNTRLEDGPDWNPPSDVKTYLDAGLANSYTQYPKPKRYRPLPVTPFDQDLDPVIKYLESLMESEHDHNS